MELCNDHDIPGNRSHILPCLFDEDKGERECYENNMTAHTMALTVVLFLPT